MAFKVSSFYRHRKNFGKIDKIVGIPNLIEMQKQSYSRFLQDDVSPEKRENVGLQAVFKSVFPIWDFSGTASLEFKHYSLGEVKYDVEECLQRGMTYEAPIKITVQLVVYEMDRDTGVRTIRNVKEQEIYFGTIPLMTENGTFIINGTERVIVSQLHRSPGVFFDHDKGATHRDKLLYSCRIIPLRGSWIDLEFDAKDILYVRIDRRRKFPVTLLLKALGYSSEELLNIFYETDTFYIDADGGITRKFNSVFFQGDKAKEDILDPRTGDVIVKRDKKITRRAIRQIEAAGITVITEYEDSLINRALAHDIVDPETGEVLFSCNDTVTLEMLATLKTAGIKELNLLFIDGVTVSSSLRDTLFLDKVETTDEAVTEIYRKLRPTNPATLEVAEKYFSNLFFKSEFYDLSDVGRLKLNLRLGRDADLEDRTLSKEDILLTVKKLIEMKDREEPVDDIDHLG
ncbi:MAG: DNA-directed RNA polymerase subunit beta, partial [Deltaproteobacteria bacterium]|nr:DNA-directed RNA polymerase subunit beta [Deltaproteobacteria bacterium]